MKKVKNFKAVALILLITAVFLPLSVYAVLYYVDLRSKANVTEEPKDVQITNLTDTFATISWITPDNKTIGYVKFGVNNYDNVAFDKRDVDSSKGSYNIHYVELQGLKPRTTYKFKVVVGGKEYDNPSFNFTTGFTIETLKTPLPIIGEVSDPTNDEEEVIVFMYLKNGNDISAKNSTLTSSKRYSFDLSIIRTEDNKSYFENLNNATVYFIASGGKRGDGSIITQIITNF